MQLADAAAWGPAAAYVALSTVGGVLAVAAGLLLGRAAVHPAESVDAELVAGAGRS